MITFSNLGNMGRLGNQLFQIATCVSTALDKNTEYKFPKWEWESFFNLKDCFGDILVKNIYKEKSFEYSPIECSTDCDLYGFFQSEKYFINNKDVIFSLFSPTKPFSIRWNLCSIHVRRGDYLNLPKAYTHLGMDYYLQAMDIIKSERYLIFSDDINWCKRNFVGQQFVFAENNVAPIDLFLQSSCEHNIIANSSFSWWAAYLNKNPDKKVIAPTQWFGPDLPHNTKDLIPTSWTKI